VNINKGRKLLWERKKNTVQYVRGKKTVKKGFMFPLIPQVMSIVLIIQEISESKTVILMM